MTYNERIQRLGPDVEKVIDALLSRLEVGHQDYGVLRLDTDTRDFKREGQEELLDYIFYALCKQMKEKT